MWFCLMHSRVRHFSLDAQGAGQYPLAQVLVNSDQASVYSKLRYSSHNKQLRVFACLNNWPLINNRILPNYFISENVQTKLKRGPRMMSERSFMICKASWLVAKPCRNIAKWSLWLRASTSNRHLRTDSGRDKKDFI